MSLSHELRLARPDDDRDLRRFLHALPAPAAMPFLRSQEPSCSYAFDVMGDAWQVLIARSTPDAEVAAIACRAERAAFVNGQPARVATIGPIGVAPGHLDRRLIRDGLRLLHGVDTPGVLTTAVVAPSRMGRRWTALAGADGLAFHHRTLSTVVIDAIHLGGNGPVATVPVPAGDPLIIRGARTGELATIAAFLRREGARRQLYPAWTAEDLAGGPSTWGLDAGDIGIAIRDGDIVGCLAMWDQTGYKQAIARTGEQLAAHHHRPWARTSGPSRLPPLAPSGTAARIATAALVAVVHDDRTVMGRLLDRAAARAAGRGLEWLLVGMADGDPLRVALDGRPRRSWQGELIACSWGSIAPESTLDDRIPYVELATL